MQFNYLRNSIENISENKIYFAAVDTAEAIRHEMWKSMLNGSVKWQQTSGEASEGAEVS